MALRGVIFDLDGTLADTLPVCFAAYRETFQFAAGRTLTNSEIRAMFGPSDFGLLERRFDSRAAQLYPRFLDAYRRAHRMCRRPFEGIMALLGSLEKRAIRTAIVTGKGADTATITLEQLELAGRFDPVEAGSDNGARKPESMRAVCRAWGFKPDEIVSVGDSPSDLRSAREVGAAPLAAAWASTADIDALARLNPAGLFRTVEELEVWLRSH